MSDIDDWPLWMAATEHYNYYKLIVDDKEQQWDYDTYCEHDDEEALKAHIKSAGRDPEAFYGDVFGFE